MRKSNFPTIPGGTRQSVTNRIETNTSKIIAQLKRQGWHNIGGGRHDKFEHSEKSELLLIVPRHCEVSFGVARDIAKKAGW